MTSVETAEPRLLTATRIVLWGAGALAVVAGPVLFLFPGDTGSYFAWKIGNPLTPNFMGANYLAGAGAVWAAIIVFGVTQLIATLLHLHILKWSHPTAWAWLIVYIVSPIGAIWVTALEERRYRAEPAEGPRVPAGATLILRAFAVASTVIGLALFIAPTTVADIWPWSLTPLTGRVIGGWYLSGAVLQWMLSRTRHVEIARVGILGTIGVTTLQLLGALLNHSHFDGPSWAVTLYVCYAALLGVVALWSWSPAFTRRAPASST